tara:strand:+ start:2579 stop:2812 length:234 start_codon:yes stop_codon:yes gene_type:complete
MKKYKKNYSDKEILLDQALDELELTGTLDDIYHDVSGNNTLDDLDDYEYQQEQAYGIQSKNLQFIPTDRYIKRTRKG